MLHRPRVPRLETLGGQPSGRSAPRRRPPPPPRAVARSQPPSWRSSPGATSASITRRPLTHAVGGAEVAQHPAALVEAQLGVAARDGVVVEDELAGGRAPEQEAAARRALEQPAGRRRRSQRTRQRPRGGQVGGEAVQLRAVAGAQRDVHAAAERVGVEPARDVAAAQPLDRALPRVLRRSHAEWGAYRQVNGCETKLCAQLHKGLSRATVPGNRLAASAVEEERGDPGEDRPRDTKRPAQGSEPGAKCFGGGVR